MSGLKRIFARDGIPIADIKASVEFSTLLNDIGQATFRIATSDIKCRRELLEFGNYILIEHDTLADWVGVIDTPRTWGTGYVEVNAYEVPFILQYRITPITTTITGTPGGLFSEIINRANAYEDTLLRVGFVTNAGVSASEVLADHLYTHLKNIQKNNNFDWVCTPVVSSAGRLSINIDWVERAGIETDLELSQGFNVLYGDNPLEESGEILNAIQAVNDQQGDNPLVANFTDEVSRARYGWRAQRQSFSELNEAGSLRNAAQQIVNKKSNPEISTPLTVVNRGNTFKSIRLGNIVSQKNSTVGFADTGLGVSQRLRIAGYKFMESDGTCELFAERII